MRSFKSRFGVVAFSLGVSFCHESPALADAVTSFKWGRQFGTAGSDEASSVAVRNGALHVGGFTTGDLAALNAGGRDAYARQYSASGAIGWTSQFGTADSEYGYGIGVESTGNTFLVGRVTATQSDSFVVKYSSAGGTLWSRQFGTTGDTFARGVATDGQGNSYVAGYTAGTLGAASFGATDGFVRKYDSAGNVVWTRQFGTVANDSSQRIIVAPSGSIYIAGGTSGGLQGSNVGAEDGYLMKLDSSGNTVWTRQFGTSASEGVSSVAIDASENIYVAGGTTGNLAAINGGGWDAFVVKYTAAGNAVWSRQVGSAAFDYAEGVTVNDDGTVYIAGRTEGPLAGLYAGSVDGFVIGLSPDGSTTQQLQFGTPGSDEVFDIVAFGDSVAVVGTTSGDLFGSNAGAADAFVAVVPEPAVGLIATTTSLLILRRSRRTAVTRASA